jgi:hypothetical protein
VLVMDGSMILKMIVKKECGGVDWIHLTRIRSRAGSCEHGNDSLHSIRKRDFLHQLSNYSETSLIRNLW